MTTQARTKRSKVMPLLGPPRVPVGAGAEDDDDDGDEEMTWNGQKVCAKEQRAGERVGEDGARETSER